MTKKKVLCWSDSAIAGTGFGTVSRHILTALHNTGKYDIDHLAINFNGDFVDKNKIPWQQQPAKLLDPKDPHGLKMFQRTLVKGNYDIVWVCNDLYVTHKIADIVTKIQQHAATQGKEPPIFIYYYPVDCHVPHDGSNFLKVVDIPVCYTHHGKAETIKTFPETVHKLREIPHGVDTTIFHPLSLAQINVIKKNVLNVGPDTTVVINFNRNSARKQMQYSILAFKKFREYVPNSIMYMHTAVQDQGGDLLKAVTDLGLSAKKDVVFPTRYSPSDPAPLTLLNQLYNMGDIFLTTHLGEGWGLTVTEAMAAGVPVVAPDNTCYRPGTQVFLKDRIDLIENVKVGDKVLSIDLKSGNTAWKVVKQTFEHNYEGELFEFNTQQIKLGVTPNHKILHARSRYCDIIEETQAQNMNKQMYRIPCYGNRQNLNYPIHYFLPDPQFKQCHSKSQVHSKFEMIDFLQLLGWYVSEGSCSRNSNRIVITQKDKRNRKEIFSLLDRMKISYNSDNCSNIRFNHNQLHQVFSSLGENCYSKKLPQWVFSLHRELLSYLFDTLIKGDGHSCNTYTGYVTSSWKMVHDFAELCMCMGYTFSVSLKSKQDSYINDHLVSKDNQADSWFIRVNQPKKFIQIRNCQGTDSNRKTDMKRIPYKGKVYCVEVEDYHNLFVGENGHFVFSGNSMPQQLGEDGERGYIYPCEDMIWVDLSGYRPKGLVPDIVEMMVAAYKDGPKYGNPIVAKAREWAVEHDWNKVVKKWVELFENVSQIRKVNSPTVMGEEI